MVPTMCDAACERREPSRPIGDLAVTHEICRLRVSMTRFMDGVATRGLCRGVIHTGDRRGHRQPHEFTHSEEGTSRLSRQNTNEPRHCDGWAPGSDGPTATSDERRSLPFAPSPIRCGGFSSLPRRVAIPDAALHLRRVVCHDALLLPPLSGRGHTTPACPLVGETARRRDGETASRVGSRTAGPENLATFDSRLMTCRLAVLPSQPFER
jgi:hypothetical protein